MNCRRVENIDSEAGFGQEQESKGASFFRTCFNGVNTLTGVGILSVPYAFSEGGWSSLTLLLVIAMLCGYTGVLLKRCMDSNSLIKTYPDIGQQAFGNKGRVLVSIFIYVELYLVAVEFLILEGDNLDKLFPNRGFGIWELKIGGKQAFVLFTALLILPTTWLKSLKSLAYVSVGGVLASFIVVVCVFWVGEFDGVGFHERGKFLNLGGLPTAIGLFTFCYCGHTVFPTLYSSMKDKSRFPKVIAVCFIVSTIIYAAMGFLGYAMFGQHVKSQATLNLPVEKISTQIAIYTTLINPITKYAIVISPIAAAVEEKPIFRKSRLFSVLLRTSIVASTAVAALTVPFFGYVMAFIGAFLGVTASILLPCICYLKIDDAARRFGVNLMVIVGILVFGTLVGMMGTYKALKQIVNHL